MVIGVSGGRDSLALLGAAVILRDRGEGIEPIAVHVHHHLRGAADEEAAHVMVVCERLSVDCRCVDIHPAAAVGNCAAAARRLRYDAMAQMAVSCHAKTVLVAHHAQDQLETMITHLCRGAGLRGLGAMDVTTPLREEVDLLRPFLRADRSDLQSFCHAADLTWRDDATNSDPSTLRGWLREQVTGPLMDRFPDAARRAAGTADDLSAAAKWIDAAAQELGTGPSWSSQELMAVGSLIAGTTLRRSAVASGASPDRLGRQAIEAVMDAMAHPSGKARGFDLGDGVTVTVDRDHVTMHRSGDLRS